MTAPAAVAYKLAIFRNCRLASPMLRLLPILLLVALPASGCRSLNGPEPEAERSAPASPFQTTQRMKNGSVALEIAVYRIPRTESDVWEAIRWARGGQVVQSLDELRGAIKVGPGDVLDDVRRARAQRGRETAVDR